MRQLEWHQRGGRTWLWESLLNEEELQTDKHKILVARKKRISRSEDPEEQLKSDLLGLVLEGGRLSSPQYLI